eukprot:165249-Amorphochlora_amoeboformis.AAC.1
MFPAAFRRRSNRLRTEIPRTVKPPHTRICAALDPISSTSRVTVDPEVTSVIRELTKPTKPTVGHTPRIFCAV